MNWNEIKIYTSTFGIDTVTGVLMNLGVTGFIIEDKEDFNEFLADDTPAWDYVDDSLMYKADCETNIKIYLPDNSQGRDTLSLIKSSLENLKKSDSEGAFGRLFIESSYVNEKDWANNWKKYFKPFAVGENLLIKPTWEKHEKP